MAVARADKLSQEKFNTLATLANGKPIAGRPYTFSPSGGWKTELERMRQNLFSEISKKEVYGGDTPPSNRPGATVTFDQGWVSDASELFPMPVRSYVSGPWPIPSTNRQDQAPLFISPLEFHWVRTIIGHFNGGNYNDRYFANTLRARQVSYIFPSISPPTTKLIFRLAGGCYVKSKQKGVNSVTFKIQINSPKPGRLHGKLYLGGLSITPDAAIPTITGPSAGNFTVASEGGLISASCDFYTSGAVEFTLSHPQFTNLGARLVSFGNYRNSDPLFFDLEFTDVYEVAGIHPSQKVYRIDTESSSYLNGIGISNGEDSDPVILDPAENIFYIGNVFTAAIIVSDATHGIFVGKTIPVSGVDLYHKENTYLDPNAVLPALEPTRNVKAPFNPFFIKVGLTGQPVRPAVFNTIPRFPVQRSTDAISDLHNNAVFLDPGNTNYRGEWDPSFQYNANDSVHYSVGSAAGYYVSNINVNIGMRPGIAGAWGKFNMDRKYDQRVYYGSILRDVYVRRQPTLQGKLYLPRPADDCPALNVELGCIRNGAFVSFQTVTIPEGKHGMHIFPFWPVFDIWTIEGKCAKKLIYRCAEVVDVQASIMMPQPTFGVECNAPKLADFYNDTEALLNLL